MAAYDTGKMILFVRSILWDLDIPQEAATVLYEDNDACTAMGNAQKPTPRTRHIDIKYFSICEWIERDLMILEHIDTTINMSDHFTKGLSRALFHRHADYLLGHIPPAYSPIYKSTVGTYTNQHVDVTAFGYEIGQVPRMPAGFTAHPALISAAEQSINTLGFCKTKKGLITTGDVFMCQPERIAKTRAEFPTMLAVEMEGAAIAQACHQLNTPFVVIRSLSDIAGKESPSSFEAYLEIASKNSSAMVLELLKNLKTVQLS